MITQPTSSNNNNNEAMAVDAAQRQSAQAKAKALFASWRSDWNSFISEVLGVTLDSEQRAIVSAVQHNHRVSVRSGTARGKDYVAACIAVAFLYLTPRWNSKGELVQNTKVALTAPTDRQVKNIMMPEISRLFNRAKKRGFILPGKLNAYDIRTGNEEWFLTGFKADEYNHEAWSGFHAVNTMFVVTEATGISDDTFAAIEGNLQGNSRILLVFNPNTVVGYAARSQKSDRWQRFCLNSLTAPNVVNRKLIYPGQVDYDWVVDKVKSWCTPIKSDEVRAEMDDFEFEGKWYRPEDLFRKKVLGQFPKVAEDTLIPLQWLELAHHRWDERGANALGNDTAMLGVDVAGMGRDCTCFVRRKGALAGSFYTHNSGGQADHMKIAGKIMAARHEEPDLYVSIDTIGEGAGVYARCMEVEGQAAGNYIISCKYSAGAKGYRDAPLTDVTGQYQFSNMRAYLFWAVRDWLNPKNETGAMLPPDSQFDEEATEIKWSFKSDGRIFIEPKEDIKKRLGRSPDKFDAFANTFYPIQKQRNIDIGRLAKMIGR